MYENEHRTFFFFFFSCLSLFETTEICLGCTRKEISTGKRSILHREKIGKSDFAAPEIYFSYASAFKGNKSCLTNFHVFCL